jgi:release factor glutamine methyltransferase
VDTIKNTLNGAAGYLKSLNIPSAQLDSEILLSYILKKDRTYLYQNFHDPLSRVPRISNFQFRRFKELIERRGKREPVSYITGEKEFWSLKFKVTRDTLIPRPETEILVQAVLDIIQGSGVKGHGSGGERQPFLNPCPLPLAPCPYINILDIGTGCGNIPISIAKESHESHIFAIDRSDAALSVAKENAIANSVAERITFLKGDLYKLKAQSSRLKALKYESLPLDFDIIVSNPPYIPSGDIETLMPEVKDWEPRGALDGGKDGLDAINKIIADAPGLLKSGGHIVMEIGFNQTEDVKNIIEETGKFSYIRFIKDLAGIERVVTAELKSV